MINTQQSFDNYSLGDLYNVLKAHESEIYEIAKEGKLSLGGPLALVLKVSGKETEVESTNVDGFNDEGFVMNSDDEVVA